MTTSASHEIKQAEADLTAIAAMDLIALRAAWRKRFRTDPHPRLSGDLLRRALAYQTQEVAHGRLRSDTARKLIAAAKGSSAQGAIRLKPGTLLIREWHGRTHAVRASEQGFDYNGRHFASLTAIAREITGASWSGPRFFALLNDKAGAHG